MKINLLSAIVALSFFVPALADEVFYLPREATWKYLPGQGEASSPDPAAWRGRLFDDGAWQSGAAPFGYGETFIVTNLAQANPPMQGNYSTLFLRRQFQVASLQDVTALFARAIYDDGFVLWINGVELLRINVPGQSGDPLAYDGTASTSREGRVYEEFELLDAKPALVEGTNVVAVQVFNVSLSSSDLVFDLELLDPFGPDRQAPQVQALVPAAGSTVRSLSQAEVTFDEAVEGVSAGDLLINNTPAQTVSGTGPGPYVFTFPQPAVGTVEAAWAASHGIADLSTPPNPFAPAGAQMNWTWKLDPDAPAADLVLNEILASNNAGLKDEDGEAPDWIEVLNRGGVPVNLGGMSLSNDREEPGQWVLPARVMAPGEHLVIFASGKDRRPASGNLHTSFQLNAAGEYLGLFTAESPRRVISELSPRYPEQRTDISYGRTAGGGLGYFQTPTPGAANGTAGVFTGFAAEPRSSAPRGFYSGAFSLELVSPTPGASVVYTLDGREPTQQAGTLYQGPLSIDGTPQRAVATVRAAAYKPGLLPSETATWTFIFPEHVLAQPPSPAGFPTVWGSSSTTVADYELDPDVINNPLYTQMARDGLLSIPAVSVVTDVNDLFSSSRGIYANPSASGPAWERAVSAELIYPDGRQGFQIDCGLRIQGGSSTSGWKSLKVSMRFLFKGSYGASKLVFPLYEGSPVKRFDSLVLDAGLNLTWNHPDHGQRVRSQYVRDQYVSDLQIAAGWPAPHGVLVNLYLDGLYWGVFDLHERPDASFSAEYFGGDKDEYDCLRHTGSTVVSGTTTAWNTMMSVARAGLSSNAQYEALQEHLDIVGLADYMIVNFFVGNDDWPHHNWYASRRRLPGAQYRFFSWDAEHVLKDAGINMTSVSNSNSPAELYALLRGNAEFRLLFADRAQRLFFNGGPMYVDPDNPAWDPSRPDRNVPAALYMKRIEEIDSAIVLESARWGDVRRPLQPYTRNTEWNAELNWLRTQYFPVRSRNVLNQLRGIGLYPNVGAPVLSQHGGQIQPGFQLALSLPAGTSGDIHYTTDGSDPRVYGTSAVSPSARTYASPLVLQGFTRLKARTLSGATWSALTEATFNLSTTLSDLQLTEIHYNPPEGRDFEFLELHNPGASTLELGGLRFTGGIGFFFNPEAVLAPGEYLVLVANPAAFESRYPGVDYHAAFTGTLANEGERIEITDGAGNTVLSVEYDDDGFWPLAPDGFGHSLVLADPQGDPDRPESWRASAAVGGSPGTLDPQPAVRGGVVVNEVLARAAAPLEGAVELYNPTSAAVSIGGWYLSDRRDDAASLKKHRIAAGTSVPAGGYLVLYEQEFNASPGSPGSFALDPRGGGVYLSSADGAGNLTGTITGAEFPAAEPGESSGTHINSSGRRDFVPLSERSFGVDSPASLAEFRTGKGKANALPRVGPVVLNEIGYHPPEGEEEFLELYNLSGEAVALHDAALGRGWQVEGILDLAGIDSFEFPAGAEIPARGYLLVVALEPAAFRTRYGIPAAVPILGPYGGALENGGEWVRLKRPLGFGPGQVSYALVDAVRYNDRLPWAEEPDGGGPTLERVAASSYGNDALNWDASRLAGGTPGGFNSVSAPGENQPPVALFDAQPPAGPAPLLVRLDASTSFDPDGSIASYEWDFGDGRSGAGRALSHEYTATGTFTVVLRVTDDRGARSAASRLVVVEEAPVGGGQIPGDVTQDGVLDISDAVAVLGHLFLGAPAELPCDGGTIGDPGNIALADSNGDGAVDIADAVTVLVYLFVGGDPPVLGIQCVRMAGCREICSQ